MKNPSKQAYQQISEIQHLGILQSRIHQAGVGGEDAIHAVEGFLEQLPYALSAAAHSALALASAEYAAIEAVRASRHWDGKSVSTYQLEDYEYHPAAFAVDRFLDAARRAQNAIWPYLSKVLRRSIPQSFADLFKRVRFRPDLLPGRINELICDYWTGSGQRLKEYRDLSQHHAVVSSDGRITLLPDGRVAIYLLLPNNPSEKEPGRLEYLDPRVDALPYVWKSYWDLYSFVFELIHLLLSYTTKPALEVMTLAFKGHIRMGGPRIDAHEPIDQDLLVREFLRRRARLLERLEGELPREGIQPTLIIPKRDASA